MNENKNLQAYLQGDTVVTTCTVELTITNLDGTGVTIVCDKPQSHNETIRDNSHRARLNNKDRIVIWWENE